MSYSNPINLSDSSLSDLVWDEFVLNNPGRVEKEVYEEVSLRKRTHMAMSTSPSVAGPLSLQPMPQNAIIKEDSSDSMSSYISPYESTDDDTSSRVLVVPPLATIFPSEDLQAPPARALLTAPPVGLSSSSPPIGGKVIGLACPKVWSVIEGRRAPKVISEWAFPKKP